MSAAWTRFAHIGDPSWPRYDVAERPVMVRDASSTLANDPDRLERQLLGGPPVNLLAPGA